MLLYAVLLAALPLALACPCPPAPDGPKVCGSDLLTYPSQCHLECTAVQGLSLKHPGPCSATEEEERWGGCFYERRCDRAADCDCDRDDKDCKAMCWRNCFCGCLGYPRGGMDEGLWEECRGRRRCRETYEQCAGSCGGEECETSCSLDNKKCECDCLQRAYPAPQRKGNWTACLERHQCRSSTCGECAGAGPFCAERCKKRCRCACAGWPRRDLSGEWEECFSGTQTCEQAHEECKKKCRDQGCKDECFMAREDCSCECLTAIEEEWRLWGECKMEEQWGCMMKPCGDCHAEDTNCRDRCKRNCLCGCLGINADRLDVAVLQCQVGCQAPQTDCLKDCDKASDKAKRQECQHSCKLASEKCYCECARSRPPERVQIIQHCNYLS